MTRPAEPAASPAQKRLEAIRNRAGLAATDWSVMSDGSLCLTTGSGADMAIVATIRDEAPVFDRDYLMHLPDDHRWLLDKYDRLCERHRAALAEIERLSPKPERAKDYAAECAMKCANDHLFHRFLQQMHQLEATDLERIKTRVRNILSIQSMAELNTDDNARQRWQSLKAEFHNWRKTR